MGADIGNKINSPQGKQDYLLHFLEVLYPPQFLFKQSYIVSLKEIGTDKETEQAQDNLDIQEYVLYENQWLLFEFEFFIDHQF